MEQKTYAIIQSGSKQYRVEEGEFVDVELLPEEAGSEVAFEPLFVSHGGSSFVGKPFVSTFVVKGRVESTIKGPKIDSIKYKPSHNICRHFGHRQQYARVRIVAIEKAS